MVKGTGKKSTKKAKSDKSARRSVSNLNSAELDDPKKKAKRLYDAERYRNLKNKANQGREITANYLAQPESSSTRQKHEKATQTELCQIITPSTAASPQPASLSGQEATPTIVEDGCLCQSDNCLECKTKFRDALFDLLQTIGSTLIVHCLPLKDRRKLLTTTNRLKGTSAEDTIYKMYIEASARASRLLHQSWDLPPSSPPPLMDDDDLEDDDDLDC